MLVGTDVCILEVTE